MAQTDRQKNRHTDPATYRPNWPMGRLGKNNLYSEFVLAKLLLDFGLCWKALFTLKFTNIWQNLIEVQQKSNTIQRNQVQSSAIQYNLTS